LTALSACLDTSALIDLLDENADRHPAVLREFQRYKASGMVFITDIVFSEASVSMPSMEMLQTALDELGIARIRASDEALYLAGQVYAAYKRNKGEGKKDGVQPDFLIGAVAQVEGLALITFNDKDFVKRFPNLEVVSR
jgi:predicted nucleic acid-binding protein